MVRRFIQIEKFMLTTTSFSRHQKLVHLEKLYQKFCKSLVIMVSTFITSRKLVRAMKLKDQ